MGKHKPIFDPSTDCGDYVVVTNCAALHTTGRKKWQKTYYRHSTRPGSLKALTMDRLMEKQGGAGRDGQIRRQQVCVHRAVSLFDAC